MTSGAQHDISSTFQKGDCHVGTSFRSLKAIDRVRAQWLGPQIERYVQSLDELHTSNTTVRQHVRALGHFNDFVIARGVTQLEELPDHMDAFVEYWHAGHGGWCKDNQDRATVTAQSRVPVERMLCLALPDYTRPNNRPAMPFANTVPGFLPFLSDEKGLRQESQHRYIYTLRPFEAYLNRDGIALSGLEPAHISGWKSVPRHFTRLACKAPRAHCASFCGICIEKASWLRILYVVCRAAVSTAKHLFHAQSGGRMSSGYWPALTVGPSWASATTPF